MGTSRRIAVLCIAGCLVAGAAAVARADIAPGVPDPTAANGPIDQNIDVGDNNSAAVPDTDYTPHYKPTDLWKMVGGAKFPRPGTSDTGKEMVDGSPTDFSDALFAVSFYSSGRGFVGGQSCHDSNGDVPEPGTEAFGQCKPVLYGYTNSRLTGESWRKVDLPGGDKAGFVGSIAWIGPNRALAVGGSGTYARRERELSDAQVQQCAQEGAAAAKDDPSAATSVSSDGSTPPRTVGTGEGAQITTTDNPLHFRPVKNSGSARALEVKEECANRLREQNDRQSGAGAGRVWLYDPANVSSHDGWRELSGNQLPDGMTALTAVACDPVAGVEFCFAGGLGQIWQWQAPDGQGAFTKRFDRNSPSTDILGAPGFRYRVRQIRFVPTTTSGDRQAFAVTDGCCPGDGLGDVSPERGGRILAYAGNKKKWYVRRYGDSISTGNGIADEGGRPSAIEAAPIYEPDGPTNRLTPRRDLPDSFYSVTATQGFSNGSPAEIAVSVLASPGGPPRSGESSLITEPLCMSRNGLGSNYVIAGVSPADWDAAVEITRRSWLSSARLVASDGDVDRSSLELSDSTLGGNGWGNPLAASLDPGYRWVGGPSDLKTNQVGPPGTDASVTSICDSSTEDVRGDGVPDWVVGQLQAGHIAGLGAQGLIYGNNLRPPIQPGTIDSPCGAGKGNSNNLQGYCGNPNTAKLASGSYKPTDPNKIAAYLASKYLRVPTYGLDAINVIGDSGQGWAVGEHGALLRLAQRGGDNSAADEPPPASVGAHRAGSAADASPFEGTAGPAPRMPAGLVPAISSRPVDRLPEPQLVPSGSPNPAVRADFQRSTAQQPREIAMSRDGSEGWAVGARYRNQRTTLMHYVNGSWSLCEITGIPGQVSPDPACSSLQKLASYIGNVPQAVQIQSVARVPFENDSDPSNDGDFELVALGTNYRDRSSDQQVAAMIRYRDGRWHQVPQAERAAVNISGGDGGSGEAIPNQVSFTAPNDGWILGQTHYRLFHYDGRRWTDCQNTSATVTAWAPGCGLSARTQLSNLGSSQTQIVSAGDETFLSGTRLINNTTSYPMILVKAPGKGWSADPADGGLDPGGDASPSNAITGTLYSISVTRQSDGALTGWAIGNFTTQAAGKTVLLRLTNDGWQPYDDRGAVANTFDQFANQPSGGFADAGYHAAFAGASNDKPDRADAASFTDSHGHIRTLIGLPKDGRILSFDPERDRWQTVNRVTPTVNPYGYSYDQPAAIAPDNQGGAWVSTRGYGYGQAYFFHYTDHPPQPVFTEAPSPQASPTPRFTSLAGTPDGTVWLSTASDLLYRYKRGIGWDSVRIPGWDPGRVVTRPSEANATAVNSDGVGIVVGRGGRIADLSSDQVKLDAASGSHSCSNEPTPPCSTGYSLRAAAVAPDGSAIAGGDRMALLWRPGASGEFEAMPKPQAAPSSTIAGVSMPRPDEAWLATDSGLVFHGQLHDGSWDWGDQPENTEGGDPITLDENGQSIPIRAISLNADGHGYAVGDRGLILYRTGDGKQPWLRLPSPFRDSFTAVQMGANDSGSALIGGRSGVILTAAGEKLAVARPADWSSEVSYLGERTAPVVGLSLLPGQRDGQTEAWAALGGENEGFSQIDPGAITPTRAPNEILHFASDPGDPVLSTKGVAGLPDADPMAGSIAFAALGNTHCDPGQASTQLCPEWSDSTNFDEAIARRTVEEIAARADKPGGPLFTVFTGDAVESPGRSDQADWSVRRLAHWRDQLSTPLDESGVALFGTVGKLDLARLEACPTTNATTGCARAPSQTSAAGESSGWRAGMASQFAPWGSDTTTTPKIGGYDIAPVPGGDHAQQDQDLTLTDPSGTVSPQSIHTGGANTHYAFDLTDGSDKRLRVILADTSTGSLTGSAGQQPSEPQGQQAWLQQMLCREGESNSNGPCTRGATEPAVVVSTSPTYTYGPGQGDTETDGAVEENLLLQGQATALIAGRIGWNGLSYTCAAGVHDPGPGGSYPTHPPEPSDPTSSCSQAAASGDQLQTAKDVANGKLTATGLLPTVVSASAGGPFASDGSGKASDGFWHGYSIVHVDPSKPPNDPAAVSVEQRPILDWIQLDGDSHVLRPSQKLDLKGFGREPIGVDPLNPSPGGGGVVERYDEISTAAITHRYDLVYSDPDKPWFPLLYSSSRAEAARSAAGAEGARCEPYICLPADVGHIDAQSGAVTAGSGQQERTFALAILSVGDKAASYPLVFEPRPSFRAAPAPPPIPLPPASTPPPAPAPPAPAPPFQPPTLATPPPLAPLPAQTPPAPPVPPAPPNSGVGQLDLFTSPPVLSVAPAVSLFPPSAPVINVAPPTPARPVEKAKKVAVQSSGSDSDAESKSEAHGQIDMASAPPGPQQSMTRHENNFTALAHGDQTSAWARDLQWGGGLTLMALVAAFGWITVRPTPKRRQPEVPAPSWSRIDRR